MANPIQYSELYAKDVQQGIQELNSLASQTDTIFQDLAKTLISTNGRVTTSIKAETEALNKLRTAVVDVDVAQKGAAETLTKAAGNAETLTTKVKNLKDQQKGLKEMLEMASGSVDANKAKIASLTAEYNSLGTSTDKNKAKMHAILKEVTALAKEQNNLTSAMSTAKKGVDLVEGSYNRMNAELNRLRKELKDLPNAINQQTGAWNKNNPAVQSYLTKIQQLDTSIKKVDATLGQHQRNVGNYSGALNGVANRLATLAAGYITVQAAMNLAGRAFDSALQTDAIRTVLEFTFKSADVADRKLKMLRITADRLGVSYVALANSYKMFTGAAIASNFPLAQAEKIFNSVANAGAKLKLTSDQMEGALRALQQMISKGNVQAEELRGQLGERLPGAFAIAARAMGVTEKQLNKMLENGDVLAKDLLPRLAIELDKTFGNDQTEKIESLQSSWERLKNTFDLSVEASGIKSFFKALVDGTNNWLASLTNIVKSGSIMEFLNNYFDYSTGGLFKEKTNTIANGPVKALPGGAGDVNGMGLFGSRSNSVDDVLAPITGGSGKGKTVKAKTALEILKAKIDAITESLKLQALQAIQTKKAYTPDPATISKLKELEEQLGFAERGGRFEQIDTTNLQKGIKAGQNKVSVTGTGITWVDDAVKITGIQKAIMEAPMLEMDQLLDRLADADAKRQMDLTKVYSEEIQKRLAKIEESKQAFMAAMDVMRESGQVLGEIFGPEFGNLFTELTTTLEDFVVSGKVGFEQLAEVAIGSVRAINEGFQQGSALRIEQLQLEKQAQVDIAGTNKDARLNIEKEYNDKIRGEKIKQARLDKQSAIFQIAINTAVAASQVTAKTGLLGIPLIPLIIALGALQIAAVLARPIPKFRTGTQSAPGGLAEVAEEGPEAIISPAGHLRIAHKRQITHLERGSKVLTASETRRMFDTQDIERTGELHARLSRSLQEGKHQEQISVMTAAFQASRISEDAIGKSVGREIAKLPFQSTTWDERGIIKHIQKGNTTTKMLNDRYSLK